MFLSNGICFFLMVYVLFICNKMCCDCKRIPGYFGSSLVCALLVTLRVGLCPRKIVLRLTDTLYMTFLVLKNYV